MNTAVLLGAGSSVAAGFPSTQCLTNLVLSGYGVRRHTNASYYICGTDPPAEASLIANRMARRLYVQAERYYSTLTERKTNYEDLFYLALQVWDDQAGEMENPAILPFINELRADMSPLIEAAKDAHCHNIDSFFSLIRETRNYIADIVWRRLCDGPEPDSLSHLDCLVQVCNSNSVNVTSISTLCHDTHVETFLRGKDIGLSDGFSESQADARSWNGDFSTNGTIPYLKLHGSVNWFSVRSRCGGEGHDGRIVIPLDGDHYHTRTDDGQLEYPVNGRPLLLIGTFNKISAYSSGIFGDLHQRFRSTISEANKMVICGYGFGDKGINTEILEWYYQERGRELVVIHPDPDDLFANARPAIQRERPKWQENGSIQCIRKQFEEVETAGFEAAIAPQQRMI